MTPVLGYYSNIIVDGRPGSVVMCMPLFLAMVQFLFTAERVVIGFHFFVCGTGPGRTRVVVPLVASVRRHVDKYVFAYFIVGCAFYSPLA